ncbi:tyrosine-type recombinase/integrase [Agrococcus casei]|uniref:tyrosine-type recombinase/integrase n=2 Tax=Agrococcus casei TaxID=343512 RepID=UPI003F932F7D
MLPDSRVRADARWRTWSGTISRLRATAETRELAEASLMAKTLEGGHGVMLSKSSTVDELAAEWLTSLRIEGRHRESTIEAYDRDIRSLISPALGQVRLGEVTSRLIEGFIRSTMQRSLSGARRARIALHQMFTLADRMEVVRPNPVTPTTTPPKRETEIVALTLEDVHIIRAALAEWAARTGHGRRQNTLLPDAIEVMLGTALRISEVLAIRAHHLDTTGPVTKLRLKSSVVYTRASGNRTQETLKRDRQKRAIPLPHYAEEVLLRRVDPDGRPDQLLFPSAKHTAMWTHNFRRALRKFLSESTRLAGLSVDPKDISPKVFRKTVATFLANEHDVKMAAELLGHARASTTSGHYVKPLTEVDPAIAEVLGLHFALAAESDQDDDTE